MSHQYLVLYLPQICLLINNINNKSDFYHLQPTYEIAYATSDPT